MSWFKIEEELPDKPEVLTLAGLLGLSRRETVGVLVDWFRWVNMHCTNACTNASSVSINGMMALANFCECMQKIGWLLIDGDGMVTIVDFEKHNGSTAKKRAMTANRVAKHARRAPDEGAETNACTNAASVSDALPRVRVRDNIHLEGCVSDTTVSCARADARPSREDLVAEMSNLSLGLREDEREVCAAQYLDAMDERGWVTHSGMPVTDWRASARKWARSWALHSARESARGGGKSPAQTILKQNRRDSNDGACF